MTKLFFSTEEAVGITGLSRTSIWRLEKRGDFPARRQITPQRVGFLACEVLAWAETRPLVEARPEMAERARGGGAG